MSWCVLINDIIADAQHRIWSACVSCPQGASLVRLEALDQAVPILQVVASFQRAEIYRGGRNLSLFKVGLEIAGGRGSFKACDWFRFHVHTITQLENFVIIIILRSCFAIADLQGFTATRRSVSTLPGPVGYCRPKWHSFTVHGTGVDLSHLSQGCALNCSKPILTPFIYSHILLSSLVLLAQLWQQVHS